MTQRNVRTVLGVYEAFNRRDLDTAVGAWAEDGLLTEMGGAGRTMKGRDEIKDYLAQFIAASSDWRARDIATYDCGDTVIVQAVGGGTNDGPLGPLPATGRYASVPFCEIWHFDSEGRVVANDEYYDQFSLLVQLGHVPPPASA